MRMLALALDDVRPVPRARRGRSVELVLSPLRHLCPVCSWTLGLVTHGQPALLWLHGFGGTVVVSHWWCGRCGYHRHAHTLTVTPR